MTDQNSSEENETPIAIEILKSFALSAAVSAGSTAGLIGVGMVISKVRDRKAKKLKAEQEAYNKKFNDIVENQ